MQIKKTIIVIGVLLLTSFVIRYFDQSAAVWPKKPLKAFPMVIGEWQGTSARFDKRIYEVLGVDDSILSNYRNNDGDNIQFYIGFYGSQREGNLIHSPKNCMPGSGWNIVNSGLISLNIPSRNDPPVKVIRLFLQKGMQKQMVLYWFHSRGRVIASEYSQRIYLVLDSILRHRTDGSFVRLTSSVGCDEQHTLETMKRFAIQIFPLLDQFLPS